MTLGWIQTVLHTAILQLPESTCPASEKIEAVSAINKVSLFATRSLGGVPEASTGALDSK